MFDNGAENKI